MYGEWWLSVSCTLFVCFVSVGFVWVFLEERDVISLCSFCWMVGLKLSISASAFQVLKLQVNINTAEFLCGHNPFLQSGIFLL